MYDYIIVGGGVAGSVLANRLSESTKTSVLLLDAGMPENNYLTEKPSDWYSQTRQLIEEADETEQTLPQMALNGRKLPTVSHLGLGGGDRLSYSQWQPPEAEAFDSWGLIGWSAKEMAPVIEKAEATLKLYQSPLSDIGRKLTGSLIQDGHQVNPAQLMVSSAGRSAIVENYIQPTTYRSNMTIRTDAHVLNLLFKDGVVKGVRVYRSEAEDLQEIIAHKEVILCAGAIRSPQILLLSGIGAVADINRMSLFPRENRPGVGENFIDPPAVDVLLQTSGLNRTLKSGFFNRQPDIKQLPEATAISKDGLLVQFWPEDFESQDESGYRMRLTLANPSSVGRVSLRTTDGVHMPRVNPNYLDEYGDVSRLEAGVKMLEGVFNDAGLANVTWPKAAQMTNFVTEGVRSSWQYQGSCRMGAADDEMAVVDADCRVIGIEGVRVVDGSILPKPLPAGTLATAVLVAERAAQKIKK
ncbi:MAG: GMC family oxidoreductase, partial [Chloroflexota bacterium]